MVLANPAAAVATGAVFAAVERRDCPAASPAPAAMDFAALVRWLAAQRNDLQAAAVSVCPAIADVLAALADAALARMSGSGATCFAPHGTEAAARTQAARIARSRPDWWVVAAPVAPPSTPPA